MPGDKTFARDPIWSIVSIIKGLWALSPTVFLRQPAFYTRFATTTRLGTMSLTRRPLTFDTDAALLKTNKRNFCK